MLRMKAIICQLPVYWLHHVSTSIWLRHDCCSLDGLPATWWVSCVAR